MSTAMHTIFAVSLLWLVYIYLGYPAILAILARLRGPAADPPEGDLPSVTVLTAAFNEAASIAATVQNKLELDYPPDRLEIVVVSDESTDGTDDIVRQIAEQNPGRVRLIRQVPRAGKTSALNLAMPQVQGDIVVFADANSIYDPAALRHLVRSFVDPVVGYVTGKMVYTNPDGSITGDGCTAYMRYENALRAWESAVGSVVGVDGGIDAVRRPLYRPMNADQLPDFVLPLNVVASGHRVAYQPEAVLRESALGSADDEYRMRVRVSLRALWALYDMRHLMNPLRDPVFAWQLTSHKLLRYLAFLPQILAFLTNAWLFDQGPGVRILFVGQVAFYLLAGLGYWASRGGIKLPGLATVPFYLSLLNLSCLHAFWRFIRGQKQVLWTPRTG